MAFIASNFICTREISLYAILAISQKKRPCKCFYPKYQSGCYTSSARPLHAYVVCIRKHRTTIISCSFPLSSFHVSPPVLSCTHSVSKAIPVRQKRRKKRTGKQKSGLLQLHRRRTIVTELHPKLPLPLRRRPQLRAEPKH